MLNPLLKSSVSHSPLWHQPLTSPFDFLNTANQTKPSLESWGYLSRNYNTGVFLWFTSFDHMLQALVQGELRMGLDSDNLDAEAQENMLKMQAIANAWAKNPEERSRACHDFSEVVDFFKVEWLGQFKDLTLSGEAQLIYRKHRKTPSVHGGDL